MNSAIRIDAVIGNIASASPAKKSTVNDLGEASNATPALGIDRMYLRTLGHLVSLGGK